MENLSHVLTIIIKYFFVYSINFFLTNNERTYDYVLYEGVNYVISSTDTSSLLLYRKGKSHFEGIKINRKMRNN